MGIIVEWASAAGLDRPVHCVEVRRWLFGNVVNEIEGRWSEKVSEAEGSNRGC